MWTTTKEGIPIFIMDYPCSLEVQLDKEQRDHIRTNLIDLQKLLNQKNEKEIYERIFS